MDAYLVIEKPNDVGAGLVYGIYIKQDDADTVEQDLDDGDFLAHEGAVTIPKTDDDGYRIEVEPGWWFDGVGFQPESPLSDLELLQFDVRRLHRQLVTWEHEVNVIGYGFPSFAVMKAHDALYQAHRGIWLVINNYGRDPITEVDWSLTPTQKIKFCEEMRQGAMDIKTPYLFLYAFSNPLAPEIIRPLIWVNPLTGTRMYFADTDPTDDNIDGDITQFLDNAHLRSDDIPIGTNFIDGAWIEHITI